MEQVNKMDYVNKTHVVFNYKFKEFIKLLKKENETLLGQTNTFNYQVLEQIQYEIREWIIKNQHELILSWEHKIDKSAHSMPDFFVIFISLLIDLEKCTNWYDVYNEFDDIRNNKIVMCFEVDMSNNLIEDEISIESSCLCSHTCNFKNMAFIFSDLTKIKLWIGCDCCQKLGIMNINEFKRKVREARPKIMKAHEDKKQLQKQKRKEIELQKKFRRCNICNEFKILINEPKWLINCKLCYFKNKKIVPDNICLLSNKQLKETH